MQEDRHASLVFKIKIKPIHEILNAMVVDIDIDCFYWEAIEEIITNDDEINLIIKTFEHLFVIYKSKKLLKIHCDSFCEI